METSSPAASEALGDLGELSEATIVAHPAPVTEPSHPPREGASEDSLQSTVLWLLGLSVAQKSVGFIRSIVVCRLLDPMHMGTWGMALAVMETLLPLCLLSIPGCFGRYVEHFRRREQLLPFVQQAALLCLLSLGMSTCVLYVFRTQVATFCFGTAAHTSTLMFAVAAMIPSTIFVFCSELLVALRLGKTSTIATFCRGISFTGLTIGLLLWRPEAISMIAAFGISYGLCLALVVPAALKRIRALSGSRTSLPLAKTWAGLSRFLFAFWLTDFLGNMFFTIDRYMLVNLGDSDPAAALSQVGNYESAHVIPVLIATVVLMVARLALPYLVREWEHGKHDEVRSRTHLYIKLTSLVLFAVGWTFVFVSKPIFDVWFRGQYESGLTVVPLAVAIYSFAGLAAMWMNYFLCQERAFLGTLTTALAVFANVLANLALVPRFGLVGAAWATLFANVVLIGTLILVGHRHGLRAKWDTSLLAFLPLAICIPPYAAAAILISLIALIASGYLITRSERHLIDAVSRELVTKLLARFRP